MMQSYIVYWDDQIMQLCLYNILSYSKQQKMQNRYNQPIINHKNVVVLMLAIWTLMIQVMGVSPSFVTSLTQCKTGSTVLVVSSPTTVSGYDTTSTTFSFPSSFSSAPNIALGLGYLSSTYTTTTSLYSWLIDVSVTSTSSTSAIVMFNRTSGVVSQIQLNYMAVLPTFLLQVSTTKIDLYSTTLFTQTTTTSRNVARSITYRTKSNSTNAVVAINTIGIHTLRQSVNTFSYTTTISAQYSSYFQVTINVAGYNRLGYVTIVAVSYQSIATTIYAPNYLSIGYISDFSGTIPENSGASGVTSMGTIYTAMTQWSIDASNGVKNYNLSLSLNAYTLISTSLTSCRNSYVWYRQQTCAQYYFLSSHDCIACDITCNTCSGPSSTQCLSCTSTRSYSLSTKTCPCLTGYVEQGARDCTQISCDMNICKTCSYIDQCGSCYSFLFRQLSGTSCECMKYRYDHYAVDGSPFCDACHYSCYTCTSAAVNMCTSCNTARDKRQYKSANSTCSCVTGYYDANVTICATCQYTCASCTLSTYCSSCNSTKGRIYDSTSTYCMCTAGQYDDRLQQQCQTCMYTCLTCTDATSCASCPDTRSLTNTSTLNNQCTCINGYYDNGVSQLCQTCQYTCYTCINPNTCQSCSGIMHRSFNSSSQRCICTLGYYDDLTNQLCATCHVMCGGCTTGLINACTSCDAASYRVLASNGQCLCMDGYYQFDSITEMCSTCYYSCQRCVNGYECTACNALKYRTVDPGNSSKCICMNGYYDTSNQLCIKCPYYCLTCDNALTCLTCDPSTRNVSNNCACLQGYYDDGISSSCLPCLSSCLACVNGYSCTSCTAVIKYLTSTSQCACSSGYLSPACTACSYQCMQCSGTVDNCVSCNGLNFRYYQYNSVSGKGQCVCYDGYYSDNVNALCKSCQYSCATCTTSTACVTCPTNRQFDRNNQYCQCVAQYYQNSQALNCLPCHYSCANCSDYSICTACDSTNKRILNAITKLCNCQPGYYDDGTFQLCRQCAPQCKTCSAYLTCLSCDLTTNYRILNNVTSRCPCTQGYYQSTSTYLCIACHYSCLSCIDGNSCVACVAGRVFMTGSALCRCADGTFQNSTTLMCQLCTYPCLTCTGTAATCLTCQPTHTLLVSSSTCYCRTGTFQNTVQCASCINTCLQCTNALSCTSCRPSDNRNLMLVSGYNRCPCISGYQDQNSTIVVCNRCHYSCTTCINSVSCTVCADIRVMLSGTSGLCACPATRYYDDGSNAVCVACSYLCLSCDKLSSNCTSCSASAFRSLIVTDASTYSNTCLCLSKYYSAGIGVQVCLSCQYSCSTCVNSTHCQTCNSTLFRLLSPSSTTYCACRNGYYDVTNQQLCVACDYTCATCSQTSTYCLSCPTTRTFTTNTCPCNAGLFDDMVSSNPTCQSCLYLCQTCSSTTSCLTCPTATRYLNSSNLCQCLTGYYDTNTNKQCQQCHPKCKQCIDYTTCSLCYETTHLRILYSYSCICQPGYYDQTVVDPASTDYVCKLCHYSCQRCQNSLSCSSCDANMYRTRNINTGYCKCADGYYDDGTNQLCLICPFDCLTCADANTCLTCPAQRTLDTNTNRCVCSTSFYTNGSLCQSCPTQCSSCTSYSTCTACNNPSQRTLTLNACPCNSKLFPISNSASCQSCHYSCQTCNSFPNCISCSSSAHRYLTSSQCKCLAGYYDDLSSQICQSCHYSCLSCTNSSQCLTCDSSVSVNRVFDTNTKKCVCNVGYYQDATLKICLNCNYSCYTCDNPNTCLSCSPPSLRVLDTPTLLCNCPVVGYYDKVLTSVCAACEPTCYKCTTTSTTCTDCNTATTYRQLSAVSTCVCKSGYFQSTGTVICSTCSYKCLTCTTVLTQCTSCSVVNNRDSTTLPSCACLAGFYDDGLNGPCQLCDYRCLTCVNGFKCATCDAATHHRQLDLVSQMCKCSNRYYQPTNSAALRDAVCLSCHYSCLTCNHATLCLTCDLTSNTRYFNNGQCLCSLGYYDNNSSILCLPCPYYCLTCTSSAGCSTCNSQWNRFMNVSTSKCDCLIGYYDVGDGVNPVCSRCQLSCYTCTNSTHCQTCKPLTNKYVNTSQATNYCICYYGYYEVTSTGICRPCHYTCQRCSGTASSCTVCDAAAHRVLQSGSCVCATSYFDDGTNQLCLQCTTNCIRCFGSNSGQCLQCTNGTYLLNGICWNTCPQFYYPVNSTWKCESCTNYCTTCTNNTICILCQSGFYLIPSTTITGNIVCISPCPQFWYHDTTSCIQCVSPCLHCTGKYLCVDCVEGYYLDNSSNACYPCHSTCRFCTNSAAIGCISCVDGYFLNASLNLCVKLSCSASQYVNTLYGCYSCSDTYPNSLSCNSNTVTNCMDGYMLKTNTITSVKECIRCDLIAGYTLVYSTGLCQQVCGDGIRYSDPCDDGNTLNGDGCSAICSVQQNWECTTTNNKSVCGLAAGFKPEITAQSITKVPQQNKISVILILNIGLRLMKQNFHLKFGNLQQFVYSVTCLNSKYTRYRLDIQYLKSVYKDKLSIVVKSPIQTTASTNGNTSSSGSGGTSSGGSGGTSSGGSGGTSSGGSGRQLAVLHEYQLAQRLLQALQLPLTINLDISLDVQVQTSPPALYYSPQNRQSYVTILYAILIFLHVSSLLISIFFTGFYRLKTMLYTIQFLNFITVLYMYSTYGLYNVSQLTMESARALQHFIYKFGQDLPSSGGSVGYFGFGGFILAGCIVQIVVVVVCVAVKMYYGGSVVGLSNADRQTRQHRYNVFRYYHISFLYAFMPQFILCCVIVFKWIEMNLSIQSSYSWGIAIILTVTIMLTNTMYILYAYPYARIIQKNNRNKKIINPLPFSKYKQQQDANVDVKQAVQVIGGKNNKNSKYNSNNTMFVTVEQAIDMKKELSQKEDNIRNEIYDPFADQNNRNEKSNRDQFGSVNEKSQRSYSPNRTKGMSRNSSRNRNKIEPQWSQQNRTQAVIFDIDEKSQLQQSLNENNKPSRPTLQTISQYSHNSKSTSKSQISSQLIPLFDLTPTPLPSYTEESSLAISYYRLLLHFTYLPFKCCIISLFICIVCQVQQPIPRCALLISAQVIVVVYMFITMKVKNWRFINCIVQAAVLIGIAACGLAGGLVVELSKGLVWSNQTRDDMTNTLYILQAVQIGLIYFGVVWNIAIYILSTLKSVQYRKYRQQKKVQQQIQKNLRKNRLRNVPQLQPQKPAKKNSQFILKNIFSGMRNQQQNDDRIETKQHLRMDSQGYTPAQFNNDNTNSNIILGIRNQKNRADNLDILDIENIDDYVEGNQNTNMHKKLKNTIDKNVNQYSTVPLVNTNNNKNKNNKIKGDKQLQINSLQSIQNERETNNLQSTRINDSGTYMQLQKIKQKQRKIKEQSKQERGRENNFMAMLQKQLMNGEDSRDTVIIVKKDERKGNNIESDDRDNTLISYKQSEKSIVRGNDKKKGSLKQNVDILANQEEAVQGQANNNENVGQVEQGKTKNKNKSSYSIIKDLIPTREHEQAPTLQQNANKKVSSNRKKQILQRYLNQNYQREDISPMDKQENQLQQSQQQQQEGDGEQLQEEDLESQQQGNERKPAKHYKYGIKGNNSKSKEKNKIGKALSGEQALKQQPRKGGKIKKSYTSPYTIGPNTINKEEDESYYLEQEIEVDKKKMKKNKYNDKLHMEKLELPAGIKNQEIDEQEIQVKKVKKGKAKNVDKKDRKGYKIRRIDSISSIQDDLEKVENNRKPKKKFGESEEQPDESEGVTVFKKILQDYQIYKNKRVVGNPLKRKY